MVDFNMPDLLDQHHLLTHYRQLPGSTTISPCVFLVNNRRRKCLRREKPAASIQHQLLIVTKIHQLARNAQKGTVRVESVMPAMIDSMKGLACSLHKRVQGSEERFNDQARRFVYDVLRYDNLSAAASTRSSR